MTGAKIIVEYNLKSIIKRQGFQVSSNFIDSLQTKTLEIVVNALDRAKQNNRTTVMSRDL